MLRLRFVDDQTVLILIRHCDRGTAL